MEIRIGLHTLERIEERGSSEEEVRDVIKTGFPMSYVTVTAYVFYGKWEGQK